MHYSPHVFAFTKLLEIKANMRTKAVEKNLTEPLDRLTENSVGKHYVIASRHNWLQAVMLKAFN